MCDIRQIGSLILLFAVLLVQSSVAARTNNTFKTDTAMLQVAKKGIYIEVYQLTGIDQKSKKQLANATLLKTEGTDVSGSPSCKYGQDCKLTIKFDKPEITLNIKMKYDKDKINGYWEWTSLTIGGAISDDVKDGNGDMNVTPVPGFTKSKVDINCQRDYTICAPLKLSWTCDDEIFKSKKNDNSSDIVSITFPGLQLQPFFGANGSQALRFGANWDCDPLISSALWISLLITLALAFAFYWAVDMISSLHTPDKFDDPKGKQIMVPTTD
jgi:hypothetical protein